MSIKEVRKHRDMRILFKIARVRRTKQSVFSSKIKSRNVYVICDQRDAPRDKTMSLS